MKAIKKVRINHKTMNYKKIAKILINIVPVLIMIGLIPFVQNDYVLTLIYVVIIAIVLFVKYEKREWVFLLVGFFGMMISEYIFTSTRVEVFVRDSLFGLMPIWLPFLWAYSFVVMKRAINIMEK